MAFYLSPLSTFLQLLTNVGVPLSGGLLWTYAAGTSTPTTTYTDSTGGTPNSNPIQMDSNGRLPNVNVWQPGGTAIKFVFSTNAGTTLVPVFGTQLGPTFDQVTGINDPVTLLTELANPASGTGVDLVANAVKSYDVFASVRSASAPSLAAGQTLVIDCEGALLSTDSGGGLFYWNATSVATDDGSTVLKPNSIAGGSPGRYLRQKSSGYAGTVTVTLGDCTTAPTTTAQYFITGNIVVMRIPQLTGTSNSTSFRFSITQGLLAPSATQYFSIQALQDNGAAIYSQVGTVSPISLGVVTYTLYKNGNSAGWTNSGTKGISDGGGGQVSVTITYLLN